MQRERISENVYWFQSEIYAQVTAGAITGPQWAVVIDTLAIPEETLAMRSFIEETLGVPVRYIINTHHHADHTWGNCFFPGATVISHTLCRELMELRGPASLESARRQNPAFKQVKLVYPHLTFEGGDLSLRIGKKNLILTHTPGHSRDGISVLVEEDRVLFAGDAFLPLPYVVDGDPDVLSETIRRIGKMGLENIIQGTATSSCAEKLTTPSRKTSIISITCEKPSAPPSGEKIHWKYLQRLTLNPVARAASISAASPRNCTNAMCAFFSSKSPQRKGLSSPRPIKV